MISDSMIADDDLVAFENLKSSFRLFRIRGIGWLLSGEREHEERCNQAWEQ